MRKSGVPLAMLRWISRLLAPGPEMIRSLSIRSSPLVSVMVLPVAKLIVSPGAAPAIASRSEPGPSSAVVVTVAAQREAEVRRHLRLVLAVGELPQDPECLLEVRDGRLLVAAAAFRERDVVQRQRLAAAVAELAEDLERGLVLVRGLLERAGAP